MRAQRNSVSSSWTGNSPAKTLKPMQCLEGEGGWAISKGQKSAAGLTENERDLPVTKGLQSRTLPIITKHF